MSESFNAELTPLESSLARLVPRAEGLSRERMLFEAGRSCGRPGRLWPALTGLSSLTALVLAGWLLMHPPTMIVEERMAMRVHEAPPVLPPAPVAEQVAELTEEPIHRTLPANEYLRLREEMLCWGMDALPAPVEGTSADSPLTPADLLAQKPPRSVSSLLPEKPSRLENLP
jgi:hypothetical protein